MKRFALAVTAAVAVTVLVALAEKVFATDLAFFSGWLAACAYLSVSHGRLL